jgi:hypothetical protein
MIGLGFYFQGESRVETSKSWRTLRYPGRAWRLDKSLAAKQAGF